MFYSTVHVHVQQEIIFPDCVVSSTDGRPFKHNYVLLSYHHDITLNLLLLNTTCPVLANSEDPDQLASEEAKWSGAALFVIKYVNVYQNPN